MRRSAVLSVFVLLGLAAACSSSDDDAATDDDAGTPDASTGTPDASTHDDGGLDASTRDGGHDANTGSDASIDDDGGSDASTDDGGSDASTDDAGLPDAGPPLDTPPSFVDQTSPASILSSETATLTATADDPDADTTLTYTWSVVDGGGTLAPASFSNQIPGTAVSTVYTPAFGFFGVAHVQVSASDGTATTSTTFEIAIGAVPDVTIVSVQRTKLVPSDTSQIQFQLTNPVLSSNPGTMLVHTSWSDSCGGIFDVVSEDVNLVQGNAPVSGTVTYTASPTRPAAATLCDLVLTAVGPGGAQATATVTLEVDPPMVLFVSSASVPGNAFHGSAEAADAFCQSLADAPTAAVPPGAYHALISFDDVNAKDGLVDAPFSRPDGTLITRSKADLYGIDLLNAIRNDENNAFPGVSAVYTGTNGDGTKGTNCLNWTSTNGADDATAGINATATNPNWTNSGTFTCSAQLPIYCVQQP